MRILHRANIRGPMLLAMAFAAQLATAPAWATETISFSDDIFPILQIRCLECHVPGGDGYEKSGLDLRTYQGLMKGTKFGPMVIPGDAFVSNLMVLLSKRAAPEIRMPHNKKRITSCDKDLIRRWINQGALDN